MAGMFLRGYPCWQLPFTAHGTYSVERWNNGTVPVTVNHEVLRHYSQSRQPLHTRRYQAHISHYVVHEVVFKLTITSSLVNLGVQGMHTPLSVHFSYHFHAVFSRNYANERGPLPFQFYAYPTDLTWHLLGTSMLFRPS